MSRALVDQSRVMFVVQTRAPGRPWNAQANYISQKSADGFAKLCKKLWPWAEVRVERLSK